ncbi:DUF953-domain-containing protein [Rhizoclosmatium globosum]|uniref:DUF953-domain-containing protein n=1 Tax=Rhizoclosmatium globosum TaxID=329046 RepID=A0A1Y2CI95_9FUNG|nr:DUF953-domain-containing protein [Rhizoclosmatium globosum]|eukprot:ORY46771.1 DUF953-domain-containing protein [Rhizoclosmatium globosum]
MTSKTQRIDDFGAFDATLASALTGSGRVFAVLFASEDPATGESWCPDCRVSDPLIKKAISKVADSTLLLVPTGDRPTWRNPEHPYRKHENLKVTNVPTLYEFGKDGKVIKKLVEAEITEQSLEAFIA